MDSFSLHKNTPILYGKRSLGNFFGEKINHRPHKKSIDPKNPVHPANPRNPDP